jgi:hypothetical protein
VAVIHVRYGLLGRDRPVHLVQTFDQLLLFVLLRLPTTKESRSVPLH